MKRYRIITLGCKVNQCESAALGHLMENAGWNCSPENDSPDVIVINTCSVTGRAAMQSRQAIRQAIRRYPAARVIATGCYAQTAAGELQAIEGIERIVGHNDKMRIAEMVSCTEDVVTHSEKHMPSDTACAFTALPAVDNRERTRAFLKIQDGCDTRCTYCIVPHARGHSRSMPLEDARAHLCRLGSDGIREVVLTGIHLGAYGNDLKPATSLAGLLARIVCERPVDRIRLSSIEPTEVDGRIVEMMADPKGPLCRHFHIPLQSGDNGILRRMGRPYGREQFVRIIEDIQHNVPDVAIGLDVMAGFPGETDEAFLNTYHLVEALPVGYLHVFPFSPRKGTPAAGFENKVPQSVIKERCRRLRVLGAKKKAEFYRKCLGQTVTVLIETAADAQTGHPAGLSDNYVPVVIPGAQVRENTLVTVRIESIQEDGTIIGRAG
ncbi:MAG: tRNA (N(6)-L-threonylcarbamoyladenosine(37)-C(2))-methylthiotransferase MtaB [Desulfobacteraceae bacterium]|nr:MAG: tRNA (N(6)-L-threonylcarbamoyladenosine(37)-C(2))-methylthiotransferase MtaB [Desulfobacteraceae bacterium]